MKHIKKKRTRSIVILGITEGLILIVFLISAMGNYFVARINADRRSRQIVENSCTGVKDEIDRDLKNIAKAGYTLLRTDLITRLKVYYYDLISENLYARNEAIKTVTAQIISLASYYDIIDSCAVWIKPASEDLYYNTMYTFVGDPTRKELIDDAVASHIFVPQYKDSLKNRNANLVVTLSLSEEDNCIIAFLLDTEYFSRQFRLIAFSEANTSMTEKNGEICAVCTTTGGTADKAFEYSKPMTEPILKNGKILYYTRIADALPLYIELEASELDNTLAIYMVFFIVAFLLLFGVSLVFLLIFNHFLNKPVQKLLYAMERVGKGDFNALISDKISTDFQNLYDGFNSMVMSINGYVEDNYRQKMMRTESEFKALQAQINPHFLYNCFANIRSFCKSGDMDAVESMTGRLSKMFLYITRNAKPIVSLKDEVENMRNYLEIQRIRFGERVNLQIETLPSEFENLKIPKLCLQPIVENAYKYVFSEMESGGILKVSYTKSCGELRIITEDNGNNLTDEQMEELCRNLGAKTERSGLVNVARRLEHYAEERGRLELKRSSLGGLAVIITLNSNSVTEGKNVFDFGGR